MGTTIDPLWIGGNKKHILTKHTRIENTWPKKKKDKLSKCLPARKKNAYTSHTPTGGFFFVFCWSSYVFSEFSTIGIYPQVYIWLFRIFSSSIYWFELSPLVPCTCNCTLKVHVWTKFQTALDRVDVFPSSMLSNDLTMRSEQRGMILSCK